MDKLCRQYDEICIKESEITFSLSLLAISNLTEVRAFFKKCDSYFEDLNMNASTLAQAYAILRYSFCFDDNPFYRSVTKQGCLIAELYDKFEGNTVYLLLKENSLNRTLLNLYIEIAPPLERVVIC